MTPHLVWAIADLRGAQVKAAEAARDGSNGRLLWGFARMSAAGPSQGARSRRGGSAAAHGASRGVVL